MAIPRRIVEARADSNSEQSIYIGECSTLLICVVILLKFTGYSCHKANDDSLHRSKALELG